MEKRTLSDVMGAGASFDVQYNYIPCIYIAYVLMTVYAMFACNVVCLRIVVFFELEWQLRRFRVLSSAIEG